VELHTNKKTPISQILRRYRRLVNGQKDRRKQCDVKEREREREGEREKARERERERERERAAGRLGGTAVFFWNVLLFPDQEFSFDLNPTL